MPTKYRMYNSSKLITIAALLAALPARAQAPSEPLPPAEDDLELPATPVPERSETLPPASPNVPSPAPVAAAPPAAATTDARGVELDELRRRIAALEAERAAKSAPEPSAAQPKRETPPELAAPSARVVPLGVRLGGYLQGQFESSALSEDQIQQGGALLNQNRFLVRRGRIRFDRGFQYALASLELDANTVRGVSVGIRRAEATLLYRNQDHTEGAPLVAATLGVTDIPFGYELSESAGARPFMERSTGSGALFPTEADLGLRLWGALDFLRYGVALMNGEPLDSRGFPGDPNTAKDVVGRLGVAARPAAALSVSGGTSFAVGRGFHRGQGATKNSVSWSDVNGNGAVDPGEVVGLTGSASTPSENFRRWALGLDLELTLRTGLGETQLYGEVFVASNYDRGFALADPVSAGLDVQHAGAYGALVQQVTEHGLVGFRAAYYDPNSNLIEQRRDRFVPIEQSVWTLSPLIGAEIRGRARLIVQYDFIRDHLARNDRGAPADAENDVFTVRLQVQL